MKIGNPSIVDTSGTASGVLIKGGVLISGVALNSNTLLYSQDIAWCPGVLIEGDVLISGVCVCVCNEFSRRYIHVHAITCHYEGYWAI